MTSALLRSHPHRPDPRQPRAPGLTPRVTDEPGVRFALALGALAVGATLAHAFGLSATAAYVATLLLAVGLGLGLDVRWTLSLLVAAWALTTGLDENRYGDLTFGHGDLVRLVAALALGVVAGFAGSSRRRSERPSRC